MKKFCFLSVCIACSFAATAQSAPDLDKADQAWIQKVVDSWAMVCDSILKIDRGPLPWIIFYDAQYAWHLNPDSTKLSGAGPSNISIMFSGKRQPFYANGHDGNFWVPDRDPIAANAIGISAMPYANNKKAFFIAPLPTYFHTLAPPEESKWLDFLFVGMSMHELIHTRQLAYALPQVLDAQKKYKLPESVTDNLIEEIYSKNENYKKTFDQEKLHYWQAALAPDVDSCKNELRRALAKTDTRWETYFGKEKKGFVAIDEMFNALEGSAMWGQYQTMIRQAPDDMDARATLFWLVPRTRSWSQEQGLAMFLLLDRLVPDWKKQFFDRKLPSAFAILKKTVD